jgi:hypothetical protein
VRELEELLANGEALLDIVLPADIGMDDVGCDIEPPPFDILDIDI